MPPSRRLWGSVLLPLIVLLLPASPSPAQITTNTALPVTEGQGVVRVQSKVLRANGSGPMERELTVYGFPLVGAYGATQDLTVFGGVPILNKTLEATVSQGPRRAERIERGPTGFGDARLFGRYTVWARNRAGATQRLAPLAGVELPTGADDETDQFGRLPRPLQLGSGSWDPFAGLVFTWQTLLWQVDVSPVYQLNTEADGFAFGDEARLDVASKYRLWKNDRSGGVSGFLYGNLETNLIWQDENDVRGVENPNSGGTAWLVAPGLQYVTRRVVVEAAVQLPAVQDGHGTAPEEDFITILSLRVNV